MLVAARSHPSIFDFSTAMLAAIHQVLIFWLEDCGNAVEWLKNAMEVNTEALLWVNGGKLEPKNRDPRMQRL